MQTILTVLQVFLSLGLIGSPTFEAQGSGSFLTRLTAIMATLFFLTSMGLAYFATQVSEPSGLMDRVGETAVIPAAPQEVPEPSPPPATDVPTVPGVASPSGSDVPDRRAESPAADTASPVVPSPATSGEEETN